MSEKLNIIKMQSPEIWQWAGTTINSLTCSESLIEEFIDSKKRKIEKAGMDLLDIHVFKWDDSGYEMATIEFLIRPKQNKSSKSAYLI
ncbi:hypothetical protein LCM23_02915 [Cytobacillus kochii]|uniref:hypothetical protein n=1 Tax=Cytobacillus kochii TaxID=859143 RepID=UPI001CD6A193|nr:hypothetical protein [Cytobacillus kochii]MCA1025027.1 hypothetical protein [Cytobacillus kochii]